MDYIQPANNPREMKNTIVGVASYELTDSLRSAVNIGKVALAAGADEWRETGLGPKVALGANIGALGFEWSTGNEAMLGYVGSELYKHTHNVLLSGAINGGVSFTEQAVIAGLTAVSISNFPKMIETVRRKRSERYAEKHNLDISEVEKITEQAHPSISRRFIRAFMLGAGVSEMTDNSKEHRQLNENLKYGTLDAALIGSGVFALTDAVSGLDSLGRWGGGIWETLSNGAVDALNDPLFYVGVFATIFTVSKIRKIRKALKQETPKLLPNEIE